MRKDENSQMRLVSTISLLLHVKICPQRKQLNVIHSQASHDNVQMTTDTEKKPTHVRVKVRGEHVRVLNNMP